MLGLKVLGLRLRSSSEFGVSGLGAGVLGAFSGGPLTLAGLVVLRV